VIRLLAYQLLYAPETRSRKAIPIHFLILVAHNLPEHKRERLRRDGAPVVEVQLIGADWIVTDN